jgi:CRISPR-associated endonuclease/helicase Cas3
MHVSTALTPDDRDRMVQRVRARLKYSNCANWTLVATSCVEAGVDFSFRTAIRESCSVASVIQTGGRVNRHREWTASDVWDVRLQDPIFNRHPGFEASRRVLSEMLGEGAIGPETSNAVTDALRRELVVHEVGAKAEELRRCERLEEFPRVAELYRVIDSDTRTVVVDPELVKRLNEGQRVSWRDLLRGSVQIWARKVETLGIRGVAGHEELYYWTGIYDPDFLGYMAGVLPLIQGRDTGLFA